MSHNSVVSVDSEQACKPQLVGNAPLNAPQRAGLPERLEEGRVPARAPARDHPGPVAAENLLYNQRALLIRAALLSKPGVIVTAMPYHLER